MTQAHQQELAKLVTNILTFVYVTNRHTFEAEATTRLITLEQLAAAAIVQGALEITTAQ
jgi:hypothetical protein